MQINKVKYHDKKRSKMWANVSGLYHSIFFIAIVERNTKTNEIIINSFRFNPQSPEQGDTMKQLNFKSDTNYVTQLTPAEQDQIINAIEWDNLKKD